MLRTLAPSGSPITPLELGDWLMGLARGRDKTHELRDAIRDVYHIKHCYAFSTGRAAMYFLFEGLKKLSNDNKKNEIVVPGYTCYSVASSVIMAGLKVRICDIDPETLSYDLEQLASVDFSCVLCIVTANLYGLPDDLQQIEEIANTNNVYLVDDAAQCLGGLVSGKPSGTFGIAGLYSLDKGKNITSLQGGIIVTDDDELADILQEGVRGLTSNTTADNLVAYIKILVYFLFLNPAMYWIPARLPFLNLGETRYENDYPVNKYPSGLATLALSQLRRYETIMKYRIQAASLYQATIQEHELIKTVAPVDDTRPVWLRFPLRITDSGVRHQFLQMNSRMGCTISYPGPISDIPGIGSHIVVQNGKCDISRMVAHEMVTLPTHSYVSENDIDSISNSIAKLLSGKRVRQGEILQ